MTRVRTRGGGLVPQSYRQGADKEQEDYDQRVLDGLNRFDGLELQGVGEQVTDGGINGEVRAVLPKETPGLSLETDEGRVMGSFTTIRTAKEAKIGAGGVYVACKFVRADLTRGEPVVEVSGGLAVFKSCEFAWDGDISNNTGTLDHAGDGDISNNTGTLDHVGVRVLSGAKAVLESCRQAGGTELVDNQTGNPINVTTSGCTLTDVTNGLGVTTDFGSQEL
jgi:hypothetical protein